MLVQESQLNETKESEVVFSINNICYKVSALRNISAETSLNTYIREHAHLTGTKVMCDEGGCGACVVAVRRFNHSTSQFDTFAVKSCLIPVLSCHDWQIITVEGLGSKQSGYHKLQVELAKRNGTQCGYCTPGMIMNMYSLLQSKTDITMQDVENSFDGNICRCTGYRPILETFKTFAKDGTCADIEDILQVCSGKSGICDKNCDQRNGLDSCKLKVKEEISVKYDEYQKLTGKNQFFKIKSSGFIWFVVFEKKEIFDVWNEIGKESYMLVAGNTARGVYKIEKPPLNYIDISRVRELKNHLVDDTRLVLGANMTFTEIITFLHQVATDNPLLYGYLKEIANHIELIASVPVRNIATLGGTLCLKHQHPEFPSDVFVAFETVNAQVKLEHADGGTHEIVALVDFLRKDLAKVLITEIILYPLDSTTHILKTYKIMPRARNTHAYVNAGFLLKVNKQDNYIITDKPNIVYGGINPNLIHANYTEKLIENRKGKTILDEDLLLSIFGVMGTELKPDCVLPDASPEYRGGLAASLFYKFVLSLSDKVRPEYRSGGESLKRPLSSGVQEFETDKSVWPLNKPVPKLEALYQCSGEAQYVNDIPSLPGELHGALVLTSIAKGKLGKVDASEAFKIPGVVNFFTAEDIPGKNTFSVICPDIPEEEPIFCEKDVLYNGQAVGIILATSHDIAVQAASKVIVNYSQTDKAALNLRDIIKANDDRIVLQSEITSAQQKSDVEGLKGTRKITGESKLHGQYHFTMELQTCLCVPVEDGLDVYACTQWMQSTQDAIAVALNIPVHSINMKIRRLGGGYGAKLSRAALTACACSVAAKLLNRPVRLVLTLETNMQVIGKRYPCYTTYEATVDETTGKILHLDANIFEDAGWSLNDPVVEGTLAMLPSCYDSSNWNIKGFTVRTNNASSAWCRAPGSTEAIATIENIMEHIATVMSKDPVEVRLANMAKDDNPLRQMTDYWKQHTGYIKRLENIKQFNEENRWKQRGISLVPMSYSLFSVSRYTSMVSIYGYDGTVAVTHGGIECGQGINTKVAQVCAYILGIDLHLVQIKPTTNLTSPNNNGTGGSVTSESASYATMMCCKELLKRLEPIRKEMHQGYTWQELIRKANEENVNLNTSYMFTTTDSKDYKIYGVTVLEVEVDVLTGQYQIVRADILEDAGQSLSPQVDVGQVEGAFTMGLGYYTSENLIYDQDGALKTNRTWNYYPPGALDIPIEFNVQLRKGAPNPVGILRSKATGEPPLCMSVAVVFAIHRALDTPRRHSGKQNEYLKFYTNTYPSSVRFSCVTVTQENRTEDGYVFVSENDIQTINKVHQ